MMNDDEKRKIIYEAIKSAALPLKVQQIEGLHPRTVRELEALIHQVQNLLIAEYVRFTDLKKELNLR